MKLFGWNIGRKASPTRELSSVYISGRAISTPINYENLAKEGFQKNQVAFSCVHKIAEGVASIPWLLYSGKGKRRKEIEDHPLLALLKRPNPIQNGPEFIEAITAYKLISGNTFVHSVTAGSSPRELYVLRPDRVKVVPGTNGFPAAYEYSVSSQKLTIPVDPISLKSPVLHMKSFHPTNDWYGMGAIEAAMVGIDQNNYAGIWNLSLLQNSAMPSGAFTVGVSPSNPKGVLERTQYDRLRDLLDHRVAGARNAGRPMILEGGMDWKQFSLSPKDMDWINSKNTSARDIALVFGVPGMLLGIPGDNTFNNYEAANQAFFLQTVIPNAKNTLAWLNRWLAPQFGENLELDLDLDDLDALAPGRDAKWNQTNTATWLTENEKRARHGYDPVEGGDVLFVSTSLVPIDFANEPPAPSADPADEADQVDDSADTEDSGKKSLNLRGRARSRYWLKTNRSRMAFERKMMRQASALFKSEGKTIAALVEGLDAQVAEVAVADEIEASMPSWKRLLTSNFIAIGNAFGPSVIEGLKADSTDIETKADNEKFSAVFRRWVDENVGDLVTAIADTSRKRVINAIRDHVAQAHDDGEGAVPLGKKIEQVYEGFSSSRAMTIARTETVAAMNAASEEAAKSTGIPGLSKEWISSPADGRERPEHQQVDGETVAIEEKFQVGGEEIARPGDPDASAENRINCRCTMGFVRKGDE